MEAIVPYLNFNGNAAEAMEFYSKALNGSVIFSQSYGDSPMATTAELAWPEGEMGRAETTC